MIGVQQQLDAGTIIRPPPARGTDPRQGRGPGRLRRVNRAMKSRPPPPNQASSARRLVRQPWTGPAAWKNRPTSAASPPLSHRRRHPGPPRNALAQAKEGCREDQIAVLERELDARKRIPAPRSEWRKAAAHRRTGKRPTIRWKSSASRAARNIQDAMAGFIFDPLRQEHAGHAAETSAPCSRR